MTATLSVDAGEDRRVTISSHIAPTGPAGAKEQLLELLGPKGEPLWSLSWLLSAFTPVGTTTAIPMTLTLAGQARPVFLVGGTLVADTASDEPLFTPQDEDVLGPIRDLMRTVFAPHVPGEDRLPMADDDDALGTISSTVQIGAAVGAAVGAVVGSPGGVPGAVEGAGLGAAIGGWVGLEVGVAVVIYQAATE